jgi:Holliday junction resolvase
MSKSQRTKGAAGEREWCEFLRKHGFKAQRLLGQARDGGGDVPCPPVLWEVKRRKGIAVRVFLDQAVASVASYKGDDCYLPVVAMREDGRADWMVMLRAEDFMQLIKNAHINDLLK